MCYLYSLLQQPVLALQRGPAVAGGQPLQRLPDVHLVRGVGRPRPRGVGAGEALADGELQQHLLLVIVLPVQPPRVLANNSQSVLEHRVQSSKEREYLELRTLRTTIDRVNLE